MLGPEGTGVGLLGPRGAVGCRCREVASSQVLLGPHHGVPQETPLKMKSQAG